MNARARPVATGWPAPGDAGARAGVPGEATPPVKVTSMHLRLHRVRRVLALLSSAALYLSGTGLVAMTMVVGWQIFGRYILNDTPTWSEPIALQLMAWFILLGAAVGVRESVHLGLDLLRHVVPERAGRLMDLINLGLVAFFGGAMAVYGLQLAIGTWTATIPVLGIPGGVDFFPLVGGGALIALFAAERFVDVLLGVKPAADVEIVEPL